MPRETLSFRLVNEKGGYRQHDRISSRSTRFGWASRWRSSLWCSTLLLGAALMSQPPSQTSTQSGLKRAKFSDLWAGSSRLNCGDQTFDDPVMDHVRLHRIFCRVWDDPV